MKNFLVDAMIECYVSWREECVAVALAYENWGRAQRRDKTLAFSAYLASLDREEQAAASYRRFVEQIARMCPTSWRLARCSDRSCRIRGLRDK